jgi:hypothetical protein
MRKGFLILMVTIVSSLFSCKKAVDTVQQNVAFDIITNGQWIVTRFDVGTTPKSSEYADFVFQFFSNGVVTAKKAGNPDINGNWSVRTDVAAINSNFPGQEDPLRRFNGTWLLTRTTETTVQAIRDEAGQTLTLGLRKL